MAFRYLFVALIVLLAGCATKPARAFTCEAVKVDVPVKVRVTPPAELLTPYQPEQLPEFVRPDHPDATSGLTAEGEKALKRILFEQRLREKAWIEWATTK